MKKRTFFISLIFFIATLTISVFSFSNFMVSAEKFNVNENYYFEKAEIYIKVFDDKTMHVEQRLQYKDLSPSDPSQINIYCERYGKKKRSYGALSGESSYVYALKNISASIDGKQTNVSVSTDGYMDRGKYQLSVDPVLQSVNANNASKLLLLSYDYDMSSDALSSFDDFTFRLWDAKSGYIRDFQCTIDFPKDVNVFDISYRVFANDTLSERAFESEQEGKRVTFHSALEKNEYRDYIISMVTEKGYFNPAPQNMDPLYLFPIFMFLFSILITAFVFYMHRKRLNTKKQSVSIEQMKTMFAKFDFADIAYIYHRRMKKDFFVSFVFKWASESVVELESEIGDTIKIRKLKELKTYNKLEKKVFEAIFSSGDVYSSLTASAHFDEKEYNKVCELIRDYQKNDILFFEAKDSFSVYRLFPFLLIAASILPLFCYVLYMCMVTQYFIIVVVFIFTFAAIGLLQMAAKMKIKLLYGMGGMFMMPLAAIVFFMYMPKIDYAFLFPMAILYMLALQIFVPKLYYRNNMNAAVCKKVNLLKNYVLRNAEFIDNFQALGADYLNAYLPYIYGICGLKRLSKLIKRKSKLTGYPEWMKNYDLESLDRAVKSIFPYSKQLKKSYEEEIRSSY